MYFNKTIPRVMTHKKESTLQSLNLLRIELRRKRQKLSLDPTTCQPPSYAICQRSTSTTKFLFSQNTYVNM